MTREFICAPALSKILIFSPSESDLAAFVKAVSPSLVAALTSAPPLISIVTTSGFLLPIAAFIKAVAPSVVLALTFAPALISALTDWELSR